MSRPPHQALAYPALLARMEQRADPLADATIDTLLNPPAREGEAPQDSPPWQRIESLNRLISQWVDNATLVNWSVQPPAPPRRPGESLAPGALSDEMARALERYVQTARVLPDWADARKIERAEMLFMEHGALSCILLFCSSLPECYVVPDLSSVLHTAGQLEQNTEYRIRSTAAMIFPVMMRGGLGPGGAGVAQVLKVRLIHATIRHLILHGSPQSAIDSMLAGGSGRVAPGPRPTGDRQMIYHALHAHGWDLPNDGLPCNQEELAYTLLTFGYVFLRSLRRLGVGLPREDEEAYLHAWNVVGHILGIERDLMVDTMEQGRALMEQMQARGRAQPVAPDPRPALGQALMQTMEKSLPWRVVKPFPRLMTRYLCGRATAQDLGIHQTVSWASAALFWSVLLVARVIDTVVRWVLPRFSIMRALTRILGYHFMSRVLMSQTRPLQLPTELLQQVDHVVHGWSDDPDAPRWLNRLEDRLTTGGSWSAGLASRAQASSTAAATTDARHATQ